MSLIDKLLGRTPVPLPDLAPAQRLVVPPRPFVNTQALDEAGLRRGMWVMSSDGLAIITGARIDGLGEITLQKADGTTRMELDENDRAVPAVRVVDLSTISMARFEEIPASRHEGAAHLRSFGYVNASEA